MKYNIVDFEEKLTTRGINLNNDMGMQLFNLEIRGVFTDCDWSYFPNSHIELKKDFSEYPSILERYGILAEVSENAILEQSF